MLRKSCWGGSPFKPSFGSIGAVQSGAESCCRSFAVSRRLFRLDLHSPQPVAYVQVSNVPTLNFAKNAKFRMGHTPPMFICATRSELVGTRGVTTRLDSLRLSLGEESESRRPAPDSIQAIL